MAESAQDLIGVFLGLVALWFLFGGLIKEEGSGMAEPERAGAIRLRAACTEAE